MGRARSSANRTAISKRKLINDTGRGPTRRWADAKTASCPRANRNNLWDMDALAQTGRAALLSLANVLLLLAKLRRCQFHPLESHCASRAPTGPSEFQAMTDRTKSTTTMAASAGKSLSKAIGPQ